MAASDNRTTCAQDQENLQGKLTVEMERLTRVFIGSQGLDPHKWPQLPKKIEVLARRNVMRSLDLDRYRQQVNQDIAHCAEGTSRLLHQGSPRSRPHTAGGRCCSPQHDKEGEQDCHGKQRYIFVRSYTSKATVQTMEEYTPYMVVALSQRVIKTVRDIRMTCDAECTNRIQDSMRVELAASIVNRMRLMGVYGNNLKDDSLSPSPSQGHKSLHRQLTRQDSSESFDYNFMKNLAQDMKSNLLSRNKQRKLKAQVSRARSGISTTASRAANNTGTEANDNHVATEAGQLTTRSSAVTTGSPRATGKSRVNLWLTQSGTRSSAAESTSASAVSSTVRARQSALAKARVVVSPLVQSYHNACMARGVFVSPEISSRLSMSESSKELKLLGVALPDLVAASLADVLGNCKHLTSVSFSRTVLNPGALAALMPAVWQLRLPIVHLVATDMSAECWPFLLTALQRPTVSMVNPPSEWWLTLRDLSLSGNPLGDQGLAVLTAAVTSLKALTSLDLSQTAITDWSAPQIEVLLQGCSKLKSLNLSHNQLGPLCGKACAGSLPFATCLTSLDMGWNPLSGGVASIAWSLLAPRTERRCKLSELSFAGVDLQNDDHLGLAALLRWGHSWLPLQKLDISHTSLLGVAAQCLLRQLDAILPYSRKTVIDKLEVHEQKEARGKSAVPKLNLTQTIVAAVRHGMPAANHKSEPTASQASQPHGKTDHTGMVSQPKAQKDSSNGALVEPAEAADHVGTIDKLLVLALGCRVDTNGGQEPTPRVRLDMVTGPRATGKDRPACQQYASPSSVTKALNIALAPCEDSTPSVHVPSVTSVLPDRRIVQRFTLQLDQTRPDHFVAQLLVEHELDARRHKLSSFQRLQLDDITYSDGIDVLYEGWGHPGVLPNKGTLILDVACLPAHASSWLNNPRLQFNAARLLDS